MLAYTDLLDDTPVPKHVGVDKCHNGVSQSEYVGLRKYGKNNRNVLILTFVCPCLVSVIVNDDKQDATILAYLLFLINLTRFGLCLRPSSGALDCIYSISYFPPKLLLAGVTDEMEQSSISSVTPASRNTGGQYQML
jgi:hypothetical protein